MENKKGNIDGIFLGIAIALIFVGILILASVSASFSLSRTGNTFFYLNHQLLLGLLPGLALGIAAFFVPLSFLKKWSLVLLLANVFLLILVFFPGIGRETGGAHRWVYLGPISFQPSEFLKLTLIVYIAAWLSSRVQIKKNFGRTSFSSQRAKGWMLKIKSVLGVSETQWKPTLAPFVVILGIISLLFLLQPDVGTLGIIGLTAIFMYFLAGTPEWHSLLMITGGITTLMMIIKIAPYRISRLAVFLDPAFDPLGKGYQAKQALIGIGSGGLTGVGLGLSFQKFGVLPEPISDSIFAIFSEETGFIGAFFLIGLFLTFAWRSLMIGRHNPDMFSSLIAMGIASWITIQAFVNISSMIGLLPLTGIPLPFISYGGSALMTELAAVGLLLNISRQKS